jgi:hypothetical protein
MHSEEDPYRAQPEDGSCDGSWLDTGKQCLSKSCCVDVEGFGIKRVLCVRHGERVVALVNVQAAERQITQTAKRELVTSQTQQVARTVETSRRPREQAVTFTQDMLERQGRFRVGHKGDIIPMNDTLGVERVDAGINVQAADQQIRPTPKRELVTSQIQQVAQTVKTSHRLRDRTVTFAQDVVGKQGCFRVSHQGNNIPMDDTLGVEPWDPIGSADDASGIQHARLLLLLSCETATALNPRLGKHLVAKWLLMTCLPKGLEQTAPSVTDAKPQLASAYASMGLARTSATNESGQPSILAAPAASVDVASMNLWDPLAAASETVARKHLQHARLFLLLSLIQARPDLDSKILLAMWLQCQLWQHQL